MYLMACFAVYAMRVSPSIWLLVVAAVAAVAVGVVGVVVAIPNDTNVASFVHRCIERASDYYDALRYDVRNACDHA